MTHRPGGNEHGLTLGDEVALFAVECGFALEPWQMGLMAAVYAAHRDERPDGQRDG